MKDFVFEFVHDLAGDFYGYAFTIRSLGGRETNLTDNCKSIREGGAGCNGYPPTCSPGLKSNHL